MPEINNSYEILEVLKKADLLKDERDPYWWPNSGTFDVVVGSILTQQSKWERVEKSLYNLRINNYLDLKKLAKIDVEELAFLIKPSGFYNTKAVRLKALSNAIIKDFDNFENFKENVSRSWLLGQKGIGEESADSILCYACYRDILVVDNYTKKLLKSLGYEFETYSQMQEWMMDGIESNLNRVYSLYNREVNLSTIYSRFHGKIVELGKSKKDMREMYA
jgi:endonuclease-3 related protein